MTQRVIISSDLDRDLTVAISECEHDRLFILVDETTGRLCLPLIRDFAALRDAKIITIEATDVHKNVESLAHVWQSLSDGGATRHSCMINLGGGMVTDLGGFAASTFKRGINFINIPTTLLAMVDASVGGKTGINFNGLKNEIGVFNDSRSVILSTFFLQSLDLPNLLSGYGEMIKHGLINDDAMWRELITFDIAKPNMAQLQTMVAQSVAVKERIVTQDPHEHGIRKALNLGHTIGHAFESLAMKREKPILHGYAVAFGLVCELYLSAIKTGFPTDKLHQTVAFMRENYGAFDITCDDYDTLIELMKHDKKNVSGLINFTLLSDIGGIKIDNVVSMEEIKDSLDFFREG